MTHRVGQGLRDGEVGAGLDVAGQSTIQVDPRFDRHIRPATERRHRGRQALILQEGRMDPARELAQITDRRLDFVRRDGEGLAELTRDRGVIRRLTGLLQRDGHTDQPLLRAVVEVALDPATLLLRGQDQARSGCTDLLELGLERPVEAFVLHGETQDGHHGPDERRVLAQDRVVDDRCERPALMLEERDRVALVLDRGGSGPAVGGRPAGTGRVGAEQADLRIAECRREGRLEAHR